MNNLFHIYRLLIFFWILFGLLWLGGIISLALEYFRTRENNFVKYADEFVFVKSNMSHVLESLRSSFILFLRANEQQLCKLV